MSALRAEEFPWAEDRVYLNHASTGPLPRRAHDGVADFNRRRARMEGMSDELLHGILAGSRRRIARLVGADPAEIALAGNTSWGLNLAAACLPLEPGDVVVVSDREFPANVYPWMRLAHRGVVCELAPATARGWPDEDRLVDRMQDPGVRVVAVSWVQFSTGYRVDLARLGRAARASGTYLVVDAIQGLGQLPLDLSRVPIDILSCGAQKWLLSPWGTGFVYVRRDLITQLHPGVTGWMAHRGTDDFSRLTAYDGALHDDARRFELVTLPFQDFVGLNASLDLLLELGDARIAEHVDRVTEPLRMWAEAAGVRLTSPAGTSRSGIVCVAPPGVAGAFQRLVDGGVVASLREGSIRLSPHCYSTVGEMERVVELLRG